MHRLRVLLVTMPLAEPLLPNLAIEQLAQIARSAGFPCDVMYGTLRLPREVSFELIHGSAGPALFAPLYDRVVADYFEQVVLSIEPALPAERVAERALELSIAADWASECIERCLADIGVGQFDAVGFSIGFDAQKLPSAVLAQKLKKREPRLIVIAGGTGCDGVMGPALLQAFSEFDCVIRGEADLIFADLLSRIEEGDTRSQSSDEIWRDHRSLRTKRAPLPLTLGSVPPPKYDDFLAQKEHCGRTERPLTLMLETSRGCWWGAKHHCTFCGIKAVDDVYRALDATDAVSRILALQDTYSPDLIYCTDSVLDHGYYATVLPKLAELREAGRFRSGLFFELKSNVKKEYVALLAAAGVVRAQPGIENFSTHILKAVRKGVTGLRQAAVLKWCATYGIQLIYGLLIGTPEETVDDLRTNKRLCAALHHLPPPISVNRLGLHRFSPYFENQVQYGFKDVQPSKLQALLYGHVSSDLLPRLCYEHDYKLPAHETSVHSTAQEDLQAAVQEWQEAYASGDSLTCARSDQGSVVVVCVKGGGPRAISTLTGLLSELIEAADAPITLAGLSKKISASTSSILAGIADLTAAGLMVAEGDEFLSLPIIARADPWHDSVRMRRRTPLLEVGPSLAAPLCK